ncbi:hypothetical protein ACFE04_017654 [Oxalis oulophora]
MEIMPSRYWRRRNYQRLDGSNNRKKLKIARLGGKNFRKFPNSKIIRTLVSPIKLLAKVHDAYVKMMIRLANKVANMSKNGGPLKSKSVARAKHISVITLRGGDQVDSRILLEIYKKLVASRDINVL